MIISYRKMNFQNKLDISLLYNCNTFLEYIYEILFDSSKFFFFRNIIKLLLYCFGII